MSPCSFLDLLIALSYLIDASILPFSGFILHVGVPTELIEDSKFVPLNADDPSYGPPVSSG